MIHIDFETYSEAGYYWGPDGKPHPLRKGRRGIEIVGSAKYASDPSTRPLSLAYKIGNSPTQLWIEGMPPPQELIDAVRSGHPVAAWNSPFEYDIWPAAWGKVPLRQFVDPSALARAYGLPGSLAKAGAVLKLTHEKLEDGKRLIHKFSVPQVNTGKQRWVLVQCRQGEARIRVSSDRAAISGDWVQFPGETLQYVWAFGTRQHCIDFAMANKSPDVNVTIDTEALPLPIRLDPRLDPADGPKFYEYNIRDVDAEVEAMSKLPPLIPFEQRVWELDQRINDHGVYIDVPALNRLIALYEQESAKYTKELIDITGGAVQSGSEVQKMLDWLKLGMANLDAENVELKLKKTDLTPGQRRVLELRQILSLSSCKKLYSILDRLCDDNRIRWILQYYGADRTGRWAGRGPQPQNLPSSGPDGWTPEHVDAFLRGGPPAPDIMASISGSLRGLFIAPPGKDFLCSDYSAIEAVVLACLAGEQWRIDVFKTHGKIYEMSASKITGVPFEEFLRVKRETGEHHPMRKKVGKVAELASGYQGGYGAWLNFGADKHLSEPEIRDAIKAWREASPMIVKFWYKIEDCAKLAVQYPGNCFEYRGIKFQVQNDILHLRLLSGRILYYHNPRLHQELTPWGKEVSKLTFMGNGQFGWERIDTYGGKLTENIVQATARDILANALLNLDAAGYFPVLHVHDEVCAEVPEGWGSIEEMEKLMGVLPDWCSDWPIRAAGGWRGKRYKKEA